MTEWEQLAAPFPRDALSWRVLELSEDGLRARVKPQVRAEALLARLDAVASVSGWSNVYAPVGAQALCCTLTVMDVTKSVVVALPKNQGEAEARADDALARAAERFGMRPPIDAEASYWVDYDPEAGEPLYEPDTGSSSASQAETAQPEVRAEPTPPSPQPDVQQKPQEVSSADEPADEPAAEETPRPTPPVAKSAGQQAIDRLVDRLKEEGRGLEAAKLLNAYGGYGGDPGAARELYARLRALLLGGGPS